MAEPQAKQHIDIQRVYVKGSSFNTHDTPQLFREAWTPNTHVDLNINHTPLEQDHHEVTLSVTVTIKDEKDDSEKISVEVHHAAIFHIIGFDDETKSHLIGAYCPSVIFPYARSAIANIIAEATLPPLNLAPINFDAVYQQQQKQQAEAANTDTEPTKH